MKIITTVLISIMALSAVAQETPTYGYAEAKLMTVTPPATGEKKVYVKAKQKTKRKKKRSPRVLALRKIKSRQLEWISQLEMFTAKKMSETDTWKPALASYIEMLPKKMMEFKESIKDLETIEKNVEVEGFEGCKRAGDVITCGEEIFDIDPLTKINVTKEVSEVEDEDTESSTTDADDEE